MGSSAARPQVTAGSSGAGRAGRFLAGAVVLLAVLAGGGAALAEAACRPDLAQLRWDGGSAQFAVEIADTEAERARGLMFRDSMPASFGMLFAYDRPQPVAFWMRNTRIPLDMLFIDAAGRVLAIHANAIPGDETGIPGPDQTQFVLEINGGLAARLGIVPGAVLRQPAIPQATAAWPCSG